MTGQTVYFPPRNSGQWKASVATTGALPSAGNQLWDVRLVQSSQTFFTWNGTAWVSAGGSGGGGGGSSNNYFPSGWA